MGEYKMRMLNKVNPRMQARVLAVIVFCGLYGMQAFAQHQTKRVLFIGNSYTAVNNLPQMTADLAASMGDTLIYDSNTPGGYTFENHSANATTRNKIAQGNWDYVVLQEQSQLPSFPLSQVETMVFPFAHLLDSLINAANPCAETVFYMTWGRKNGDAMNCPNFPPLCTYAGMDSLLNLRYRMMAEDNDAILSPVGAVWHYIGEVYPEIELYQSDESHPSKAGTYAAACSFYSVLFRKNLNSDAFDAGLPQQTAENIRTANHEVVYDSLWTWHVGEYDPLADFEYGGIGDNQIDFVNTSVHADLYLWQFGDGGNSTQPSPTHSYAAPGSYEVQLVAGHCEQGDTISQTIEVGPTAVSAIDVESAEFLVFPNPTSGNVLLYRSSAKGELSYRVFNTLGREVLSGRLESSSGEITIDTMSDGVYIIRLFTGNKTVGQSKFIKVSR